MGAVLMDDLWTVVLTSVCGVGSYLVRNQLCNSALSSEAFGAIYSAIRAATTHEAFVSQCVNKLDDHQAYSDLGGHIGSEFMELPVFPAYPSQMNAH